MTLHTRIRQAETDTRTIPTAYARGLDVLADTDDDPIIRSGAGRWFHPPATGKPTSRPPTGSDRQLRVDLIVSTQRLMLAVRHLMTWDWDVRAWEPDGIVYTRDGLVMCDADGSPCWREADDPATRLLEADEVSQGASQLRGMFADLPGVDWEAADGWDRDVVSSALSALGGAVGALKHAGVWALPRRDSRCGWCGACVRVLDSVVPPRCSACGAYARRTGRERPRHLWAA